MARKLNLRRQVTLSMLAHPDDAEILCAGTLLRLAELGWELHIATATAGDCGSATLPACEIAAIRKKEAANAAKSLGASYHLLGEEDIQVVFDKPTNRKTIDLFREIAPTLVFTHPRFDYMLDHEQVHLLARSAAFSYSMPNASAKTLLEDSMVPWLYYCDPLEGVDPYSGKRVAPSTYVDITQQMNNKTTALACHASQREWLRAHHGMDEYIAAMKRHAEYRGNEIGAAYAEAFVQHRGHAFPQQDILQELLQS